MLKNSLQHLSNERDLQDGFRVLFNAQKERLWCSSRNHSTTTGAFNVFRNIP